MDPSFANYTIDLTKYQNGYKKIPANYESYGTQDSTAYEIQKQQRRKYDFPDSFDATVDYPFLDMSNELSPKPQSILTTHLVNKPKPIMDLKLPSELTVDVVLVNEQGHDDDQESHIEFSGPLLTQPHSVDELLQRNESHIRRVARKSRFERGIVL